MSFSPRVKVILAAACFAVAWFATLQYRDLFQTDEGRYAEIPREMLVTGDWVTPRLDGLKYFEKPPLQYWTTAVAYSMFGESNWASRLWTALTGFLCLLMTAWAGARLFDARTGWCAALLLGGSVYFGIMGHFNTLDMGVSFFMCASLFAFLFAMQAADREDLRARRGWMYAAWAAAGFGMLSKGLEAVVLPGAVFVLYALITRDWKRFRQLHWFGGLPIFLVIAAPWYLLVSLRNPEFPFFFFVHEHFERFLTTVHHRYEPWWYFIPILIFGLLPWVAQAVRTGAALFARETWRAGNGKFNTTLFLWLWCGFIFLFFSLSDSKLGSYILPIFPALAILVGRELADLRRRDAMLSAFVGMLLAISVMWFAPLLQKDGGKVSIDLYRAILPWLAAGALLTLLSSTTAIFLAYFRRVGAAVAVLAAGLFLGAQLISSGAQVLSPVYSQHDLARQIGDLNRPDLPFYSLDDYPQSLPFYLNRTLTLVRYQGELAFGIGQEPDKWIPDLDAFVKQWQRDRQALAVMPQATYDLLQQQDVPMTVIGQDAEHVAVRKP